MSEVVQAINRTRCRSVIDIEGNCLETFVYITLPTHSKTYAALKEEISKEMPGINDCGHWNLTENVNLEIKKAVQVEDFFNGLDIFLNGDKEEISLEELLEKIDLTKRNWTSGISNRPLFKEILDKSDFQMIKSLARDRRGRKLKKPNISFRKK